MTRIFRSSVKRWGLRYIRRVVFFGSFLSLGVIVVAPATIAASGGTSAANSSVAQSVPAERGAVLVLAVYRTAVTGYVFRPVNLATGSFGTPSSVGLGVNIWGSGDVMKGGDVPDDASASAGPFSGAPGIKLLMASVPAGDYAVTEVSFANLDTCLKDSAVVVRVPPGKITTVSSGDVTPPEVFGRLPTNTDKARIRRAFDIARTNYPDLQGEPVNAEVVARIRWTPHSAWLPRADCNDSDQFSTIQDVTADTSAARAAALEEAQKNLSRAKLGATTTEKAEGSAPPPANESKP